MEYHFLKNKNYYSQLKNVFNAGVCTGYRFSTASLYLEPQVRFGYPYLIGAGVTVGLKF